MDESFAPIRLVVFDDTGGFALAERVLNEETIAPRHRLIFGGLTRAPTIVRSAGPLSAGLCNALGAAHRAQTVRLPPLFEHNTNAPCCFAADYALADEWLSGLTLSVDARGHAIVRWVACNTVNGGQFARTVSRRRLSASHQVVDLMRGLDDQAATCLAHTGRWRRTHSAVTLSESDHTAVCARVCRFLGLAVPRRADLVADQHAPLAL